MDCIWSISRRRRLSFAVAVAVAVGVEWFSTTLRLFPHYFSLSSCDDGCDARCNDRSTIKNLYARRHPSLLLTASFALACSSRYRWTHQSTRIVVPTPTAARLPVSIRKRDSLACFIRDCPTYNSTIGFARSSCIFIVVFHPPPQERRKFTTPPTFWFWKDG